MGVAAATVVNTVMDYGMGIFHLPAALGQLGEGTGRFAGNPTLENFAGVAQDVAVTASVLAVTASQLNKPYNRYVGPESKPTYDASGRVNNKTWLTRNKYSSMSDAKSRLQMRYEPTSVQKVKVPWYRYIAGPRSATKNPRYGVGGGSEYRVGGWYGK